MTSRDRAPIRVLLCVDNFNTGGTQTQVVRLANALASDESLDIHIACLRRVGPLLEELRLPHERIVEHPLPRFYGLRGMQQIARMTAAIVRWRIEVVHAHDFYANVLCAAGMGWMRGRRLIVSRRYERLSSRRRHAIGERLCYAVADRVVFNSALVADALVNSGEVAAEKVVVIPNGLDIDRFEPPASARLLRADTVCRLGIVATLMDYKGHQVLLQAAALLRRSWPHLELRIVGDGPLREQVEQRVRALGLEGCVRMVGSQRDVRPWLRDLDVAVLSSIATEGMPNALLEYLAAGLPIVATRVGGIPEVVTDGREGLLVEPGDSESLARAIDLLLRNPGLRARMSRAARLRAADFSVPRMVSAMRGLYIDLARGVKPKGRSMTPRLSGEAAHVRHMR